MAREQTRSRRNADDDDDDDRGGRDRGGRGRDRDDDRGGKGKGKGGAFSWAVKDAVSGAMITQGNWRVEKSYFCDFDYGGTRRKPACVLLWELVNVDSDEKAEETWTMGEGFAPTKDGSGISALNGQAGFGRGTKIIKLFESLEGNGAAELIEAEDAAAFEGLVFAAKREEMEKVQRREERGRDRGRDSGSDRAPSVLLVDEVLAMPGEKYAGKADKAGKRKGRAAADEDDDKPEKVSRGRRAAADDDDDDKDDKPARGRGRKAEDDDDDKADKDDKPARGAAKGGKKDKKSPYHDDAVEALIEVLEKGGGKVKVRDLEAALSKVLKGSKDQEAIVDYAIADTFLESETGWTFDGKVVAIEE